MVLKYPAGKHRATLVVSTTLRIVLFGKSGEPLSSTAEGATSAYSQLLGRVGESRIRTKGAAELQNRFSEPKSRGYI